MEQCECNNLHQNTLIIVGVFSVVSFILSVYNSLRLHTSYKRVET